MSQNDLVKRKELIDRKDAICALKIDLNLIPYQLGRYYASWALKVVYCRLKTLIPVHVIRAEKAISTDEVLKVINEMPFIVDDSGAPLIDRSLLKLKIIELASYSNLST